MNQQPIGSIAGVLRLFVHFTLRSARTAITRNARTKAIPTSSGPHQFEKDSVFFERPATRGNAEEMKNTTAATTASGRPHRTRGRW